MSGDKLIVLRWPGEGSPEGVHAVLVLTRRSKDKVSFPQVGITVHFVRVQSGHVKVGIDAPKDIAIVHDEISDDIEAAALLRKQLLRLPREIRHGIRNELHEISVGMHLYKELVSAGLADEAEGTFADLQAALKRLDENEVLQRPSQDRVSVTPETVVIVEDDANEREMLAGFLRLKGLHVITFADGDEALDYLAANDPPGVVLVDMHMARCAGPTTVRGIRASQKQGSTRVFAVSGTSPESNGLMTGEEGVDRWFPKPLNPQFLVDAICSNSPALVEPVTV